MTALLWSLPPSPDDADNPLRMRGSWPDDPRDGTVQRAVRRAGHDDVWADRDRLPARVQVGMSCHRRRAANCATTTRGREVRLADEFDEPVARGQVGEMLVRTEAPWGMNVGYYKMPAQTAAAWRNGWFHTGDAFTQDEDGNYYFLDRMRDTIRRRGENISSFEVENVVVEHPAVIEVAAIGVPAESGERRGNGGADRARQRPPSIRLSSSDSSLPACRGSWCRATSNSWTLPRVETSLRVKKTELRARGITAATWDRETAGIVV